MIAPWTLLVVAIVGTFTADVRMHSIPMMNKEACIKAAKVAADSSSSHMGYMCISSETGETLRFQK